MARQKQEVIEYRTFPGYSVRADAETGMIAAYVSLFGVPDVSFYKDIVMPGAYTKTIKECGPEGSKQIRVLWQHYRDEVIGRPVTLQEHPRDLLPDEVRVKYPQCSGGLFCDTKMVMDVTRGREAFALYREQAMNEWSIGFRPIVAKFEKVGDEIVNRYLHEIKLWEYSAVTWGAASTVTTDVRSVEFLQQVLHDVLADFPEWEALQIVREMEKRLLPKEAEPGQPLTSPEWVASLQARVQSKLQLFKLKGEVYER